MWAYFLKEGRDAAERWTMAYPVIPRSRPRPRLVVAALALSATAVAAATPAHGQTVNWTQTQIATVNGVMPSIAVDRLGYVHVGWTLGLGGSSYYAYHSTNTSGDYRTTLVDSRTSGGPTPYFPYLTTDSLGFFHMVWRDLGLSCPDWTCRC